MAATVWKGHLVFGLVSFPIRLYRAARPEKVSLRRLHRPSPALSTPPAPPVKLEQPSPPVLPPAPSPEPVYRTHNTVTSPIEQEPVSQAELVRGFEYEKDRYVVLEEEEIRKITPETSSEMQIVEFVRMDEIDAIHLETSYYVAPDEAGERPYSLLYQALRETGLVGLAQVAMHRKEHVVVVRGGRRGIIAHTMFYPDEVRAMDEFRTDTSQLNPRELALARQLVESMATRFEPEKFRDTFRDRLKEIIAAKMEGRQVSAQPAVSREASKVIDIMQALQDSLNAVKKPAATTASRAPRRKKAM